MPELTDLSWGTPWVVCFGLMLCRAGGWVVLVPMLGAKGIAMFIRSALTFAIAVSVTPLALAGNPVLPDTPVAFMAAALVEFFIGAIIGWTTGLLFAAAEMAGSMADATSGLSFASLVDPASGNQQATFARLFSIVFLAICFAADAHHHLIAGFAHTIEPVPPGVWPMFASDFLASIVDGILALMRAAIEIGAPLIGALFLTEVSLGMVSKFYPQVNVLMIGLSVKALVALTTAGLVLLLMPSKVTPILEAGTRTLSGVF